VGEAKRRRDYERTHAVQIAADLALRAERFGLIEEIAASDHEDLDPQLDARLREINEMLRTQP
jgi:hypothetical protein